MQLKRYLYRESQKKHKEEHSGAYKTCSIDALQVVAGFLPLDLEIQLETAKQILRKEPDKAEDFKIKKQDI